MAGHRGIAPHADPSRVEQRWSLPIRGVAIVYRNEELFCFGPEVFDAAGVQPYSTANTRELLMQQAAAACEYQRGIEVTEVLRDGERVVGVRSRDVDSGAERDVLADWTVGDDGPHSVIRRGCGLPMEFVPFGLQVLGFAFDWPEGIPANAVRLWLNQERRHTGVLGMPIAPLPEGRGVGLIPMWPEVGQNEPRLQAALRTFAAQDPAVEELIGNGLTRPSSPVSRSATVGRPVSAARGLWFWDTPPIRSRRPVVRGPTCRSRMHS